MNKLLFSSLILIIFSCKKEEIPVAKYVPGEAVINSFEMGSDYRKQSFFDLKTNTFVSENLKTSWDLGFESGIEGKHIFLNSSNLMFAARVENVSFNSVTDTVGLTWKWDSSDGNLNTTAIGDWQSGNYIYVIDRGTDFLGDHRGFSKVVFNSVSSNEYSFRIANLDGTNDQQVFVQKNNEVNNTAFSITSNKVVQIQPPKSDWDIKFTQYIHYFDFFQELQLEDEPYLVTGVVLNRHNVQVAEFFNKEYDQISFEDVSSLNFSSNIDAIGYDWKEFDFSQNNYTVLTTNIYIIKTTEGFFYKMRFLDFYNDQGDKGTPVFEFQEL